MFIESTFHILKIRSVKVLKLRFDKSSMPSLKAGHKSHSSTFCYSLSLFGFCPCGSFADERSGADVSLCVPFSLSHAYFTWLLRGLPNSCLNRVHRLGHRLSGVEGRPQPNRWPLISGCDPAPRSCGRRTRHRSTCSQRLERLHHGESWRDVTAKVIYVSKRSVTGVQCIWIECSSSGCNL